MSRAMRIFIGSVLVLTPVCIAALAILSSVGLSQFLFVLFTAVCVIICLLMVLIGFRLLDSNP